MFQSRIYADLQAIGTCEDTRHIFGVSHVPILPPYSAAIFFLPPSAAPIIVESMAAFDIRRAQPTDLDAFISIDEDASALYVAHQIKFELPSDHPFARAERSRWMISAEQHRAFIALDSDGAPVGFATLDLIDGNPYLDQLAVRMKSMRQGIGGGLLNCAAQWARSEGASSIWLTTYDHIPFNGPYYERHGYVVVPVEGCGPGIRHHLDEQRRYVPAPTHRVAMRKPIEPSSM